MPARLDIAHYRGDTLGVVIRLWTDPDKTQPADLSNATVTSQVRTKATDVDPPLADMTTAKAGNQITLTLPPAITQTMPGPAAVWDCQVDWESDGTSIQTVVAGTFTLTDDVTRP